LDKHHIPKASACRLCRKKKQSCDRAAKLEEDFQVYTRVSTAETNRLVLKDLIKRVKLLKTRRSQHGADVGKLKNNMKKAHVHGKKMYVSSQKVQTRIQELNSLLLEMEQSRVETEAMFTEWEDANSSKLQQGNQVLEEILAFTTEGKRLEYRGIQDGEQEHERK
jgi:predicted peroxiredoxin